MGPRIGRRSSYASAAGSSAIAAPMALTWADARLRVGGDPRSTRVRRPFGEGSSKIRPRPVTKVTPNPPRHRHEGSARIPPLGLRPPGRTEFAALVGRAYSYGLAARGEEGAARAISILRADLVRTLKLLGCDSVKNLSRDYLRLPPDWPV